MQSVRIEHQDPIGGVGRGARMSDQDAGAGICLDLRAQQRQASAPRCADRDFRSAHPPAPGAVDAPARARSRRAAPRRRRVLARSGAPSDSMPTAASISRVRAAALGFGHAQQIQGQRDILLDREVGQHVKGLEDEADGAAAQQGRGVIVQGATDRSPRAARGRRRAYRVRPAG